MDGESEQVEMIDDEEIRESLRKENIMLGKSPASCSAILQPSDVSGFFKGTKAKLRYLTGETYKNQALHELLKKAIEPRTHSAANKLKLIMAMEKVAFVVQELSGGAIVKNGYQTMGMYAFHFERLMSQCTTIITPEQMNIMKEKLNHFVGIFTEKGKLEDVEMDTEGIMNLNEELYGVATKDDYVIYRQRAILLTNAEIIRGRQAYLTKRADSGLSKEEMRDKRKNTKQFKKSIANLSVEEQERLKKERRAELNKATREKKACKRKADETLENEKTKTPKVTIVNEN
jgi:hypothetical protein